NDGYMTISLVGYTNAGKSTLLNALTKSQVVVARDQLFTTVDPTTRIVCLDAPVSPERAKRREQLVLVTDTVGFIRKLPHELVDGFESTLGQVRESDLVLAVIDIADSRYEQKEKVVFETLQKIGSDVPVIKVYNKFDLLTDSRRLDQQAVYISAKTGEGLAELKSRILS
ncbi:MAG TPA: 50S ribosome-binding GTPase, partial [bacterium]|nr:50S ribosome-binding GTPase [bacterium]